ncbi:MAG: HEPN domain-containing protein [bacterium]|nr:HEPN domain-containing protein [bacterium]MDZ4260192.1 HEPN domain-containing protein [Candidatus Sungbacteria bacterium]
MSVILERKREVIRLLMDIEKYPATKDFKQEMMVFSYVLVCGAVEFMTESILQEWLDKTIKHHKGSSYRGRKYVQYFLSTQAKAREKNIKDFRSTKLEVIRKFITEVAGVPARKKFDLLFTQSQQSLSLRPDINARLEKINRTRHEIAHGQKMPNDIQPNVSELKKDFIFIYDHIITNIKKCLPRV